MKKLIIKCDWCGDDICNQGFDFFMDNPQPQYRINQWELCIDCWTGLEDGLITNRNKTLKDAKEKADILKGQTKMSR